ncbi:MAG: hypothetical protein IKA72_04395 [Clostridia bacterium]|nr:hypothetical protein [Clostridia bacterium]
MSKLDLLKILQSYGDETELGDFTPQELFELLEQMKNSDEPLPIRPEEFKKRYFEFYDDVKDPTLKKQDW